MQAIIQYTLIRYDCRKCGSHQCFMQLYPGNPKLFYSCAECNNCDARTQFLCAAIEDSAFQPGNIERY